MTQQKGVARGGNWKEKRSSKPVQGPDLASSRVGFEFHPETKPIMKYFPLGLDLRGRTCIVVGGGTIGTRKVRSLLEAGAAVTLVSPAGTEVVVRLAETDRIRWREGGTRSRIWTAHSW